MCFVGVNLQPLPADKLIELLEELSTSPSYYFLRWTHRVGGFWQRRSADFSSLEEDIRERLQNNHINNFTPKQPEAFPSPEGQLFNSVLEVRWKQQKECYQVLILSSQSTKPDGFRDLQRDWEIIEQNALVHPPNKTRFPKGFNSDKVDIAQRYFRDRQTATVHFVALTVKN
ncbi:hypothetical protein [Scytonema sp. NUACC26]|uniref:hypothetical protein n=1 Tax=Scytonema sp. NUACC26 TaxID=3140176 RepID=UPI0034DC28DA